MREREGERWEMRGREGGKVRWASRRWRVHATRGIGLRWRMVGELRGEDGGCAAKAARVNGERITEWMEWFVKRLGRAPFCLVLIWCPIEAWIRARVDHVVNGEGMG